MRFQTHVWRDLPKTNAAPGLRGGQNLVHVFSVVRRLVLPVCTAIVLGTIDSFVELHFVVAVQAFPGRERRYPAAGIFLGVQPVARHKPLLIRGRWRPGHAAPRGGGRCAP